MAINGFGRIGRLFFRQAWSAGMRIAAINDLGSAENLAYLLKYDTVYRRFPGDVSANGDSLSVDGKKIPFFQEKNPAALPWKKLGIDVVVEATGVFDSYERARAHLEAGAKRVVITAPARDADGMEWKTVLVGVNEDDFGGATLTSNGSCTTNAVAPVVAVMDETIGVEKAILNTVHGYTASQSVVDGPAKNFRRGRAAAQNIVPSTTGAAQAVARAGKGLAGKFDGIAMRVPVISGSLADITFVAKRATSAEEINDIFRKASQSPRWKGVLAVTEDPIVSADIIGEPYGAIIDLSFTRVVGGNLAKVLSWYDNEWGYAVMLYMHVERVASRL